MSARCGSCDAPVIWVETVNGKRLPLNEDSKPFPAGRFALDETHEPPIATYAPDNIGERFESHFATCPNRDRAEIAKHCWPDTPVAYLMNRAALVHDVEMGLPVPTISRAERTRIEAEIKEEGAVRTKRSRPASLFKSGHLDVNHAEIVAALSRLGPEPIDTTKIGAGFPDLVWPFQGQTILIEVKGPDGKLSLPQERFHGEWRGGPLYVIQNAEDIPKLIEAIQRPSIRRAIGG